MATKNFTVQGGTDNNYHLSLALSSTPNVAGNYSDISYTLAIHGDNVACAYQYTNGNQVTLVIGGVTIASTTNFGRVVVSGITTVTLLTGTTRIAHVSDGGKTIAVSATFRQAQNSNFNFAINGEMVLDTIGRASIPTLSKSSADFGSSITISTNRASSGFTHAITYEFGTASGTIATGVGDSTSWTIPNSLMSQIPNATSGTIRIVCETYSGSTLIGTQQTDLTATVPASIVPTLTIAIAEAATIPSGISGYIQGRSRLKITSTANGQYGASIKTCIVTVEESDYSGTSVTTNTITGSGTVSVKVTVTDSRGRTTTKTQNITVLEYSPPKLTGVSAYRCASSTDTTEDREGAYICVMPRGSITALGNKNGKKCTVYYKKAASTTYSSVTLTMSDYVLDTEYVIFAADISSSYDVYAVLADSFTGSSTRADASQVMSASTYLHIPANRKGIGIGKLLEIEGMDVGWTARFRDYVQFDKEIIGNVYATGDVAANVSSTSSISLAQFYNQLSVIRGSIDISYNAAPTVTLLAGGATGNPAGSNYCIIITFFIDSASFAIQLGLPLAGATGVYKRECINGSWVAWRHLS